MLARHEHVDVKRLHLGLHALKRTVAKHAQLGRQQVADEGALDDEIRCLELCLVGWLFGNGGSIGSVRSFADASSVTATPTPSAL